MTRILRLCTWNIQLGLQLDTIILALRTRPDFQGLDLIALQEASIRDHQEDAEVIARALGTSYDHFQVTAHSLGRFTQANALIWNRARIKVVKKDTVKLPHASEVQLSRPERALLRTLPGQKRISLIVDGQFGDEFLRIYVAHLDVVGFAHKRHQFLRILEDARTREAVPLTIIAGDLNTFRLRSRPSWAGLQAEAAHAGFQDLTGEIRWTHAVRRLRWRQKLDAILVHHTLPLQFRSWTLDVPGSDHIPVFADVILE